MSMNFVILNLIEDLIQLTPNIVSCLPYEIPAYAGTFVENIGVEPMTSTVQA